MLVFIISFRYLRKKKWGLLPTIGITVGVVTLIVAMSIMLGFDSELKTRIRGTQAHIIISKCGSSFFHTYNDVMEEIKDIPHISAYAPYLETPAFAKIKESRRFVVLKGIEPYQESLVGDFQKYVSRGRSNVDDMMEIHGESKIFSAFCGIELLRIGPGKLETSPQSFINKGEKIVVICMKDWTKTSIMPFILSGIVKTDMPEYDESFIYVPLEAAQKLVGLPDAVSGISIKLDNFIYADDVKREIQKRLGYSYLVNTWEDTKQSFLKMLALERKVMGIILFFIIVMSGFSIHALVSKIANEKAKDIGILKAIGATNGTILCVFLFIGLTISIIGSFFGLVISIFILQYIDYLVTLLNKILKLEFLSLDNFYFDTIPVAYSFGSILIIISSTILCSIICSIAPAIKGSRLSPIDLVRYE